MPTTGHGPCPACKTVLTKRYPQCPVCHTALTPPLARLRCDTLKDRGDAAGDLGLPEPADFVAPGAEPAP